LRTFPAPLAVAAGLAIAGCGQHKLTQSNKPAKVSTPRASPSATAPARRRSSGTFTGSDVGTRFGDVQVAVTLEGGQITDVRALRLPFDRPRSQFISQHVQPLLRNEVINAQSADIYLISGATYTSEAWANSVQAALARAGR
jgi:uncharacterized protein with FMN-binding domain